LLLITRGSESRQVSRTLKVILELEKQLHPALNERDIFKLVSQAAFGGDHLLRDRIRFERGLTTEWDSLLPDHGDTGIPVQLIDPEGFTARMHLIPLLNSGIELPDLVHFLAWQPLKCGEPADFDVLWRAVPEAVNSWDPPLDRKLLESMQPAAVPSHHSPGYGFAAYRICNDILSERSRTWLGERDLYPGNQITETQ
jgi:hypothetical protein